MIGIGSELNRPDLPADALNHLDKTSTAHVHGGHFLILNITVTKLH